MRVRYIIFLENAIYLILILILFIFYFLFSEDQHILDVIEKNLHKQRNGKYYTAHYESDAEKYKEMILAKLFFTDMLRQPSQK
jgi:type IV secretory pathway VirB3-like protein